MVKPKCGFCDKELQTYGGQLFSPPLKGGEMKRLHVCRACYNRLMKLMKLGPTEIEDVLFFGPAWLNYKRSVKRKK